MKKEVTIAEFLTELMNRMESSKDINCCKDELEIFAAHVRKKIGEDKILIEWKG